MTFRLMLRLSALSLTLAMNDPLAAQNSSERGAKVCILSASVVSIRVVDAAGQGVPNATVAMTRVRDSASLGLATEMQKGSGEFALFESDALRWALPKGDTIRLQVTAGKRQRTSTIVIGPDPSGCRIVQLSGDAIIALK